MTSPDQSSRAAKPRDTLFISKATPGDDDFVMWLAPRLEAAGYRVFVDIFELGGGDKWRRKLTETLRNRSQKMLLCCSDETLSRDGVLEEIEIAQEVGRSIGDDNFIIPLSVRSHRKLFGIGGLQYITFHAGWAPGLADLLDDLGKKGIEKIHKPTIGAEWHGYRQRLANKVDLRDELLTSNWLKIEGLPNAVFDLELRGAQVQEKLDSITHLSPFPLVKHNSGFYGFVSAKELEQNIGERFGLRTSARIQSWIFVNEGHTKRGLARQDASNVVVALLRAAWEQRCASLNLLRYDFTHMPGFFVPPHLVALGQQLSWRQKPSPRRAALNGRVLGRVWMYGVSAMPKLWPQPIFRLKPRVIFANSLAGNTPDVISDAGKQHKLRRKTCTGWRNKRWHGCMMAYLKVLSNEFNVIELPVSPSQKVRISGWPIKFIIPATTPNTDVMDENADEDDPATLGNAWDYFEGRELDREDSD